ncbi:MAG: TonB-dependent receptor, partial [Lutimaribacter sp.]
MKRVFYATATASALGALTAPQLLAQEAFQLDEITVSASLAPVQISRSGVTVEVLDAEALSNAGTSVAQTLARLPGVAASSNGGLGANATLRLRGLDSKYIGVRVDGIDVADPSSTQTQYNFGGLTAAGLGRLEVLKGSQSALYGSEAIGGVINMESWRPSADGASGQANVEVGSFDTRAASLSYGVRDARGEIAFSFGRLQSEGISSNAGNT